MEGTVATSTDEDIWMLDALIKAGPQVCGSYWRKLGHLTSRLHSKGLAVEAWRLIIHKI
jgi:hypothetical protein